MPECAGCRFCCWSFGVSDMPDGSTLPAMKHCPHETQQGCAIHKQQKYPWGCDGFNCIYLIGEKIHRPDTFQDLLESLKGNIGNYIPCIPNVLPVKRVEQLIRFTRSVLATIVIEKEWVTVALPLDSDAAGRWLPTPELLEPWKSICEEYGVILEGRGSLNEKAAAIETPVGIGNRNTSEQRGTEGRVQIGRSI